MNIKKILIGAAAGALMLGALAIPAFAAKPANPVLVNNWMVYNRSSDFAKLWDDNKATALGNGGVEFTFPTVASLWYTAYLKAHYNGDLTGTTITANVGVTNNGATFVTRGDTSTSTVGLVIKSAEGNWGVNDYWWPTRVSLSALGTTGVDISASTTDRTIWTNICGRSATDTSPYTVGESCVPGLMNPTESPYDGFTNALKNVNEVGLSFGGSGYARGVAVTGGTASFQLNSFTVLP